VDQQRQDVLVVYYNVLLDQAAEGLLPLVQLARQVPDGLDHFLVHHLVVKPSQELYVFF